MGDQLTRYSIIFIAGVLFFAILKLMAGILRPLALAFFITLLFMPLYKFSKQQRIPVWIPMTALFLVLIVLFYLLGGLLTSEVAKFDENTALYSEQLNTTFTQINSRWNVEFDEFSVHNILTSPAANKLITTSVSAVGNFFSELFLAIIFAIFMIPWYRKIIAKLGRKNRKTRITLQRTQKSILDYLQTKSVISLGTAVTSGLILTLFQSDFIWTISLLIFLFNFIPNVGSILATILAIIIYFLKFGVGTELIILSILLILTQIVWGNIIEPKFAGRQLQLSPLLILISLFFWGWLWGIGGMVLSIPITAIAKIVLEHFEQTQKLAEYMQ